MTHRQLTRAARAAALLLASPAGAWATPIPLASSPDPLAPAQASMLVVADRAFAVDYSASDWSGRLRAWRIDPVSARPADLPEWDSAEKLDAPGFAVDRRVVITHDGAGGIAFRWNSLHSAQQTDLTGADDETAGRQRLDYVRGDHRAEVSQGGSLRDRRRAPEGTLFRQGDTVHSRPWFTGRPANRAFVIAPGTRPDMVYVGGNDGMLHGFDALTGVERLAYVPRGMFSQLRAWTQASARHRYLVDGHTFSGDADLRAPAASSAWATVLVGAAGAGAPGFFVLDVSRPAAFSEAVADQIVRIDQTDGSDDDIGNITTEPATDAAGRQSSQIVQLNNGRWAVLMGNGVNSRNEMPVLLLQYLDPSRELGRIVPPCPDASCPHRGSNGLSTPLAIDTNGDGKADVAYAGDLLGNVWKFDISDSSAAAWKVALQGKPLFTARDALGNRQPITSPLTWLPHPMGGVMLGFGTGRDLTVDDRSDQHVQALYGIHDQNQVIDPASLVAQTVGALTRSAAGHEYTRSSSNTVDYRADAAPGGWFMNLPAAGEKVLTAPRPLAGQKVVFVSRAVGRDYLTVLNLFTGQPSARPVFTALADPTNGMSTFENASRVSLSPGVPLSMVNRPRQWLLSSPGEATWVLDKGIGPGIRAGWRQLQ